MHPAVLLAADLPSLTSQPPVLLAAVVIILAGLAHGANSILTLMDRNKETPTPSETYATKKEMEVITARVNGMEAKIDHGFNSLRAEIDRKTDALNQHGEDRAIATHNRINDLTNAVGQLVGEMKHIHK